LLSFITAGHTDVTLFFVLSAFLLSRPFLEEGRSGRRVQLPNFYRRRALRIMPLYATAVVVSVLLCFDKPGIMLDGLSSLFFLNAFTGAGQSLMPYSAVWWSLATEIQFYLVLPVLGLCLRSRIGRWVGTVALVAWAIAYGVVVADPSLTSLGMRHDLSFSILGRVPAFLAGIAASWLVSRHGERLRTTAQNSVWLRNGGSDLILLAVLFALGLLLQEVTLRGFFPSEIYWPLWHLAESGLWGAVITLVLLSPLRTRPLISNRPLAILGLLSYSLYLIHQPLLQFVIWPLQRHGFSLHTDPILRFATFIAAFLLCITLSAMTYRLIERPFLVRKARIDR
jgi:peptidoglycan/LPS O-acetylase OafA/YrhL